MFFVKRQAIYAVVGLVLMYGVSRLDYSRLRELRYPIYAVLMVSIIGVHVARAGDARRRSWIELPGFSLQPSELGKVLLVVALAGFVVERMREMGRQTTARVMLLGLLPTMVVMAQPDLGSATVYVVGTLAILFIAGAPWRHFAALIALFAVSVTFVVVGAPRLGVEVLKPYQVDRLTAFLHPSSDPERDRLPAGAGADRDRLGREDRPRRGERHPDDARVPARVLHRLHLRRDRRDLGFRRLCACPIALRAVDLARASHPDDREEPLRSADRRRHRSDAAVPAFREHRDECGDHAHHRCDGPAPEFRRLVDALHFPGPRPLALHQRAGARDGGLARGGPASSNEVVS